MTLKSLQVWTGVFDTLDATGALAVPSVGPAGTLYVAGVATGDVVTISGGAPYKWSVTLPVLLPGQSVGMRVTATIDSIATASVVAEAVADTVRLSDGVTLQNDAITSAKFDESTAFPVKAADAGNTYIARTGADSDTLETLSDQIDALPAADWAYSSRTLTQSAAAVTAAVAGSVLTITRGDSFSATLTNIGALTGYVSLDFTVKKNQDDTDANAILRIRKNATGLTDGLITINKVSTDLTATNGSITIDDEPTGDITIALAAAETDDLVAYSGYFYDVQMITATAVTTLTENICNVAPDVTRAVA